MQSTQTTVPIRPKVGRPPAAEPPPPPVELEPANSNEPGTSLPVPKSRWDTKLLLASVTLVLAMTLVLSHFITPALTEDATPPIPPLAAAAPEFVKVPKPYVEGGVTSIEPAIPSRDTEQAVLPRRAHSMNANPSIDNADRDRLLSILSKD